MIIIKIGGGAGINLGGIISGLAAVDETVVIVHGANALRDEIAEKLGMEKKVVTSASGYSSVFSDKGALDVMMMAYSGLKNKRIVELCHQQGINAVGLSGIDGRLITARRNRGIRVKKGKRLRMLHDFSGKPVSVNTDLLYLLMKNGYTPVICVPVIDENNYAVNTENDEIVRKLHEALQADLVIQLIEAKGFLSDPADPESVVPVISTLELEKREEHAQGRMKRKMLALKKMFKNGAAKVIISDGRTEHPLQDALNGKGTVIS